MDDDQIGLNGAKVRCCSPHMIVAGWKMPYIKKLSIIVHLRIQQGGHIPISRVNAYSDAIRIGGVKILRLILYDPDSNLIIGRAGRYENLSALRITARWSVWTNKIGGFQRKDLCAAVVLHG